MQLLAGHTQTAFVNLTGLGLYAAYGPAKWALRSGSPKGGLGSAASLRRLMRSPSLSAQREPAPLASEQSPSRGRETGAQTPGRQQIRALLPVLAVLPALLLVAAQLLPSLELNGLGLRTGGLPFRQAVSSQPRLLA
jgi:hypothetical protein